MVQEHLNHLAVFALCVNLQEKLTLMRPFDIVWLCHFRNISVIFFPSWGVYVRNEIRWRRCTASVYWAVEEESPIHLVVKWCGTWGQEDGEQQPDQQMIRDTPTAGIRFGTWLDLTR